MANKKFIVGVDNFETIKTAVLADAIDNLSQNGGGTIYSRVDPTTKETGVLIAGNTISMTYLIAAVIKKISEKTGMSSAFIISAVLDQLSNLKEV